MYFMVHIAAIALQFSSSIFTGFSQSQAPWVITDLPVNFSVVNASRTGHVIR